MAACFIQKLKILIKKQAINCRILQITIFSNIFKNKTKKLTKVSYHNNVKKIFLLLYLLNFIFLQIQHYNP